MAPIIFFLNFLLTKGLCILGSEISPSCSVDSKTINIKNKKFAFILIALTYVKEESPFQGPILYGLIVSIRYQKYVL